jgi:hypothetical protein
LVTLLKNANGIGVDRRSGIGARAKRLESALAQSADKIFAEDTASTVPGAQEKDLERTLYVHGGRWGAQIAGLLVVISTQIGERDLFRAFRRRDKSALKIGSVFTHSARHLRFS